MRKNDDGPPVVKIADAAVDNDKIVYEVLSNWAQMKSTKIIPSRKRKAEAEDTSDAKVQRVDTATLKSSKAPEEDRESTEVLTIPPKQGLRWHCGYQKDSLYVRECIKDLGSVVVDSILDSAAKKSPTVYVVSGAAGIGKSWSINAFVVTLLGYDQKVFFHAGSTSKAWLITNDKPPEKASPENIDGIQEKGWIYIFDSAGSKAPTGSYTQARLVPRGVSIIFSSPKKTNYEFAYDKNNGYKAIMNIPVWGKEEMLAAKHEEDAAAIEASFAVWGGNMRACDAFLYMLEKDSIETAQQEAVEGLKEQIKCLDEAFVEKMTSMLEKQAVQKQLNSESLKDSPGHILVPEPIETNPTQKRCFRDFVWKFCSPLAEKLFWDHVKSMKKSTVQKLLTSVFCVPSPKGVLFEKVAHFLITNGLVKKFRSFW
ncbi:MAG: hypothetical protein AAFP88_03175, partial [Bacteroidota bacterium]